MTKKDTSNVIKHLYMIFSREFNVITYFYPYLLVFTECDIRHYATCLY